MLLNDNTWVDPSKVTCVVLVSAEKLKEIGYSINGVLDDYFLKVEGDGIEGGYVGFSTKEAAQNALKEFAKIRENDPKD